MPKLNLIGMIVLSLSVFAGAAVMALRASPARVDAPRVDRLIRRLADTDPDLRREAEQELKDLGRKAEPALKEAARGSDPAIAERARAILGMKGSEVPKSETISAPPPVASGIRLTLQITSASRRLVEPVQYYLRLHNGTTRAIALARRLRDGRPVYAGFGAFERIDAEGRVVVLDDSADEGDSAPSLEIVIVGPGESLDLAPGSGWFRLESPGSFRVRFVYDATEGSEYREHLVTDHHAGSALPAERFESNEVAVTIY